MRTTIVRIGNSKGIRIPKPLLKESGITGDVDISAKVGEIRIKAISPNRLPSETALLSEKSFARDWLRPEEEEAWKDLQ
jgi:antitoxin MazE